MSMRGEGFHPDIAAEAGKEGGAKSVERIRGAERSFLDSLRRGAERHRLALSFMFAGALAEAMSGKASAQEAEKPGMEAYESDDELKERAFAEVQVEAEEFAASIDDLRAPYVYVEGYDEVFREQGSMATSKERDAKPVVTVRRPGARIAEGGLAELEDKRVIVTAAAGRFTDIKSVARSEGGETEGAASLEAVSKVETALYAADASEDNAIETAKAFQTVGWGETKDQAVANALHQAATFLGVRAHVEKGGFMASEAEVTINDGVESGAKQTVEERRLYVGRETAIAEIEGFVVTKIEQVKVPTADGERSYFVAHVEGLGSTMDFAASPQE